MAAYRRVYDSHVTCRLTAKNRDQLRNPTLGNRVWATSTFFYQFIPFGLEVNNFSRVVTQQCERDCTDRWSSCRASAWTTFRQTGSGFSSSFGATCRRMILSRTDSCLVACCRRDLRRPSLRLPHHNITSALTNQRPDLQNILRQSYDCLTIMPKSRSTYDGRLI